MPILEAKGISFGYGHHTPFEKQAVRNVSFSVEKGECLAVIGHTGSGKSTLMQMLNGLLKPEEGQVLLNGEDINRSKKTAAAARFRVGLCFQYPEYQLFGETSAEDIAFGPKNMGLAADEIRRRVKDAASIVGLPEEKLSVSPFDLSGGQKRRCAIAGVIAMEPEILILDEPIAGLDPAGREEILDLIRRYRAENGATVIIVTHSMETAAEIADRVLVLDRGSVALTGTPAEIFSDPEKLNSIGLDVPSFTRIIAAIRKAGVPVEDAYTLSAAADVLSSLWKGGRAT
ncbi:MAG: energy-coupling factor transporter ATPase [Clostridia bacterium]|nr:energy-coupling factor transporter ATPase [Clostridia bacterium]